MTGTLNGSHASGLWQRTWDQGGDSGWLYRGNVPGIDLGGVGAVAFADGTTDAFVTGSDNVIYRGHIDPPGATDQDGGVPAPWSTTWTAWMPAFGHTWPLGNRPSATSWEPGYAQVALTDAQGQLWLCSGTDHGQCSTYGQPSVGITNSPTLTNLGDRRLLVAVRGTDGQDYVRLWDHDAFGAWTAAGGNLAGGSPAIVGY
jgi:hypothetical protein